MLDQSSNPVKEVLPSGPSKLISWASGVLGWPGFQSTTARGLLLSTRPIAVQPAGRGLGNSAPLQNFLACVTPGTPPRSAIGAYQEVRYVLLKERLVNDASLSGAIACGEKPTLGTPKTSTSPRNWNM